MFDGNGSHLDVVFRCAVGRNSEIDNKSVEVVVRRGCGPMVQSNISCVCSVTCSASMGKPASSAALQRVSSLAAIESPGSLRKRKLSASPKAYMRAGRSEAEERQANGRDGRGDDRLQLERGRRADDRTHDSSQVKHECTQRHEEIVKASLSIGAEIIL